MYDDFLSYLTSPSFVIPAAATIGSAFITNSAIKDASASQQGAVQTANANLAPWLQAGGAAIGNLADRTIGPNADLTRRFTLADLQADPVYKTGLQFGLSEGEKAIERKFAASGGLNSGAAAKAQTRYATDYSGQVANDSFNRYETTNQNINNKIAGVAGVGQNAANQVGKNTIGGGNGQAAASIAQSQNFTNTAGGLVNYVSSSYQLEQMLAAERERQAAAQRARDSLYTG